MLRGFNNIVSAAWYQAPATKAISARAYNGANSPIVSGGKTPPGQGFTVPHRSSAEANRHLLQQRPRRGISLDAAAQESSALADVAHTFSNAFSSSDSSPSTVLPHTSTGPEALLLIDGRTLYTIGGGTVAGMWDPNFPLTRTRSAWLRDLQPRGVPRRLRKKQIDVRQQFRHPLAKSPITRPGAVRDARVHNCNSRAAAMSQSQEVRPNSVSAITTICGRMPAGMDESRMRNPWGSKIR